MPAVLDTHAAISYLTDSKKLSSQVYSLIDDAAREGSPARLSAISLVEVVYLVERGRIANDAFEEFAREINGESPAFNVVAVDSEIAGAMKRIPREMVPDMPDRIIAATALLLGLPLVTRDQRIQSAGIRTIW